MEFRSNAVFFIAICFLFTLLWPAVLTYASEEKNNKIIPEFDNAIKHSTQLTMKTVKLLHSIHKHIISAILNHFLTIHEILILRTTCKAFAIILMPNDKNMVMFCKDFRSKEMDEIVLIWSDLKYFLNQSYANAFDEMEMFHIRENQYAVLTKEHDKTIISWYNIDTSYSKILFDKTKKDLIEKIKHDVPPKIYNTMGNNVTISGGDFLKTIVSTECAFAALSNSGNVSVWGCESYGGKIPDEIQIQLK